MTWPPDIADELPAPRDDEPASLRRDIADELADHLVTSLSRELHFTPEESAAKETILDRFGDPHRVARQLWFDALQEKIMSQRVLIGAVLILAIACLGGAGLIVMLVRQVSDANQAMQEQMAQNREANAALLDKLATLASRSPASQEPPRSMEWNPVKIRLVKDVAGGAPAEGFSVELQGYLLDTAKEIQINRTTGTNGIAEMGLVRPGQHKLNVYTPWNESRSETTLTVLPGREMIEEIVCPGSQTPKASTSFTVEWPDELRDQGLWLIARVQRLSREVSGQNWSVADPTQVVIVTPSKTQLVVPDFKGRGAGNFSWEQQSDFPATRSGLFFNNPRLGFGRPPRGGRNDGSPQGPPSDGTARVRPYSLVFEDESPQESIALNAGLYRVLDLLVGEPPTDDPVNGLRSVPVVGGLFNRYIQRSQFSAEAESRGAANRSQGLAFTNWVDSGFEQGPAVSQRNLKEQPVFEIRTPDSNHITISIPPKLVENLRNFRNSWN